MDDSEEGRRVISNYIQNQARAVRETICEWIRVTEFPYRPSRLKCLYVCRTKEEAYRWKANFESYNRKVLQLVEVSSDGASYSSDASLLPKIDGESFEKKIHQARLYWTNECTGELSETLLTGIIRVNKILETFES